MMQGGSGITITCSNCGARNAATNRRCSHCGYSLTDIGTAQALSKSLHNAPTSVTSSSVPHRVTGALQSGQQLGGRYRVVHIVGKGGFGAVYEATDTRFQARRVVAIKEMSDVQLAPADRATAIQNFRSEADLLVPLSHPNLPNVSDFFEEGGKAYLVMEFIQGKTFEEVQEDSGGPLDEQRVMNWALQLCDVFNYLHTQQPPIVFRDMKPSNVMVTKNDQIKLIDFGIARFFKTTATKDTTLLGSRGYAPLEQYGHGQTDHRSDIYALGATLYTMLTNVVPQDAPMRRINPSIFETPRQLNPSVSPATENIVLKAMAEEPDNRYQSAAEMYQTIVSSGQGMGFFTSILTNHTTSQPPTVTDEQPTQLGQRKSAELPLSLSPTTIFTSMIEHIRSWLTLRRASSSLLEQSEHKKRPDDPSFPATTLFHSSKLPEDDLKDFFIIYHKTDFMWADWIAYQLESAGCTTIVPPWGSQPDSDFQLEVSKALAKARRILIILSLNYLKGTIDGFILTDMLKYDTGSAQSKFLPVWIGPNALKVETPLTAINYLDLTCVEDDEETARRILIGGARGEYIRPTTMPRFPRTNTNYFLRGRASFKDPLNQSRQAIDQLQCVKIFVSYAHEDEVFQQELDKYLIGLKRQHLIESWYDRMIEAGNEWEQEINKQLREAHIILLLVSQNFVASEYCYSVEVQQALERHRTGDACVIPIILSPAIWEDTPIGKLQALPLNAQPITEWANRERALVNVAKEIQRSIEKFITKHL